MSSRKFRKITLATLLAFICTSCSSTTTTASVWEDAKTFGRHVHRRTHEMMGGSPDESKMLASAEDFRGPSEEEFIPLADDDLQGRYVDSSSTNEPVTHTGYDTPPAQIDLFKEPTQELANIFTRVHFNTDESILRKKEYFNTVNSIASYMKERPNMYLFVMGHCDQRASESYNLALGTRRSQAIKKLLIQRGVPASHIYTISFGKEMPLDARATKEAYAKNRRVEFKIYTK